MFPMGLWTRQFGSVLSDVGTSVSVDWSDGGVFAAGGTDGVLMGETSAGARDAFVVKYGASGSLLWTQQLGSSAGDWAAALSVGAGHVVLGGYTLGSLPGAPSSGLGFVMRVQAP